jgi:hypothetical protein
VGLSNDRNWPSYEVSQCVQSQGYKIIPVNPFVVEVLGERSYERLNRKPSRNPKNDRDL